MRFLDALRTKKGTVVIPDIKCFSPKDGDLMRGRNPVDIALELEAAGACALSVVTEEKEFHGSIDILKQICKKVAIPVLRKDFIDSYEDLLETKEAGASAILLMYSCLEAKKIEKLYIKAKKIGLDVLVETHTKEELELASGLGAAIIGINNRDIKVLERDDGDVNKTMKLVEYASKDAFIISESSIRDSLDVKAVLAAGANAVLVGTAILNSTSAAAFYKKLVRKTKLKVCGIMNEESVSVCEDEAVDMCGFVVDYPVQVPWNVSEDEAFPLMNRCKSSNIKTVMVTGGDSQIIINRAIRLKPDYIQLHYNETLQDASYIAEQVEPLGIKVIKTFPMKKNMINKQFNLEIACSDENEYYANIIKSINDSKIDAVLFDARTPENAASSKKCIDDDPEITKLINCIRKGITKRIIIAGGININNCEKIVDNFKPHCIDIMSGSEEAPGVKSLYKIRSIVNILTNKL